MYVHVVDGRITVDMNFVGVIPPTLEGESLRLRLELSKPTDALLLPMCNFYMDTGRKWVFVVQEVFAVRRDIRLCRKTFDYFEVIEGFEIW